jgi:hypothetical protein
MYDFNTADEQRGFEVLPAGTIVPVIMKIRPGQAGENGWLTFSKNSDAEMLDCEFIVTEGPYAKRKFWQYLVISGGKRNDKGESIAGNISRSTLRAILESARNIMPDDSSDEARNKRRVNGLQDFDGICFLAKLSVEKDKTGQYSDKNKIQTVITPNMKEYAGGAQQAPQQASAPARNTAPAWASGQPSQPQPQPQPQPAQAWASAQSPQPPQASPPPPPPPPPAASQNPVPAWAQ